MTLRIIIDMMMIATTGATAVTNGHCEVILKEAY